MPTLTDLEADFIPLQEAADLLGITKEKLSVITRASRYKDIFEIRVYDNKKWISKKSFQQFLNAQNVYQVIKEPEKEMSIEISFKFIDNGVSAKESVPSLLDTINFEIEIDDNIE